MQTPGKDRAPLPRLARLCAQGVALSLLLAQAALAQQPTPNPPPVLRNDPKRPVAAISQDLGVTAEQFVACFRNVSPTPEGGRPETEAYVRANKAILLSCLQQANPLITNEALDHVMDRYRPGGHAAQEPLR